MAQEMTQLAASAGAEVVSPLVVRPRGWDPAYLIGPGKAQEVEVARREGGADLVVFSHELSPVQARTLAQVIGGRVLDRTQLILDIFAQRARTREGQLQVELAQLTYLLPRLARSRPELDRLGGGIGTRGPGETRLEVDRRRIRQRIAQLQKEIEQVRRTRALQREDRQAVPYPLVSLVGYTNAGKSTLLNALTGAGVLAEDRLFATLDPTTRLLTLPSGQRVLVSDTVGFIRELPAHLVAAFRATLEEVVAADALLHVVDASSPAMQEQMEAVEQV
ncbi:MAG TPA: GTPase HflX, partial [Firmicutes bacterium]|nr:GTPase HflX [Bacillota bacterium]